MDLKKDIRAKNNFLFLLSFAALRESLKSQDKVVAEWKYHSHIKAAHKYV